MGVPSVLTHIHHVPAIPAMTMAMDADLDNISIQKIAPITLKFDPEGKLATTSAITDIADINTSITIEEIPRITLDANIAIKEIPSVRVHLPAAFNFGISLLGLELITFSLCGEAQIITEPFVPNICEICEPPQDQPQPTPQPIPVRPPEV